MWIVPSPTFASTARETSTTRKPEYNRHRQRRTSTMPKISGTYEPALSGRVRSYLNNKGITGQIVGGIQVGFIALYYETGTPFRHQLEAPATIPWDAAGCFQSSERVLQDRNGRPAIITKFDYREPGQQYKRAVFNRCSHLPPTPFRTTTQQSYVHAGANAQTQTMPELRQPWISTTRISQGLERSSP